MEKVSIVNVNSLTLGTVIKKVIPAGCQHLNTADATVGAQPSDTFILGMLEDSHSLVTTKTVVKKRMVIREVTSDSQERKKIDVFVYNDYAKELDSLMKSCGKSRTIWMLFLKVMLVGFKGHVTDGWSPISLRIGTGGTTDAQIVLIIETPQAPSTISQACDTQSSLPPPSTVGSAHRKNGAVHLPSTSGEVTTQTTASRSLMSPSARKKKAIREASTKRVFTSINSFVAGRKYNVFVVVNEVIKAPTPTMRRSTHMMLAIVDPSSLEVHCHRRDMLLHIFLNDHAPNGEPLPDLPGGVKRGDILRLRDMMVELYIPDNKIHGKMYNASQVVKFSSNPRDPVTPTTFCSSYVLTDQDREHVIRLRQWWLQGSQQLDPDPVSQITRGSNSNEQEETRPEMTISQVTREMTFDLCCQVIKMRSVTHLDNQIAILRVQDGTVTKALTHQCNLADATHDLLSQTDGYTSIGSETVDIMVTSVVEDVLTLRSYDFVQLTHIEAIDLSADRREVSTPLFELMMSSPLCEIRKLPLDHTEAKRIMMRFEEIRGDDTCDSQDSLRDIANNIMSSVHPPQVRSSTQTLSSGTTPHLPAHNDSLDQAMGDFQSPLEVSVSSLHPRCSTQEPPLNSSMLERQLPDLESTHQHDSDTSSVTYSARLENHNLLDPSPSPRSPPPPPPQGDFNVPGTSTAYQSTPKSSKRKLNMDLKETHPVASSSGRKRLETQAVRSECDVEVQNITLQDLVTRSQTGVTYGVSAVLKDLYFTSSAPCQTCTNDKLCIHDWVWGLCEQCGDCREASTLKQLLLSQSEIKCNKCSLNDYPVRMSSAPPGVSSSCQKGSETFVPNSKNRDHLSPDKGQPGTNKPSSANPSVPNTSQTKQPNTGPIDELQRAASVASYIKPSQPSSSAFDNIVTLTPFIRLKLLLRDPDSNVEVLMTLAGDYAKQFFGVEPSFQWMISEPDKKLTDLLLIFLSKKTPMYFGVQKFVNSLGNSKFLISHTTLKVENL